MSITVREILKMEPFTSCQLIAGEGGLSNIVKYTTTMEMPDIRTWLNQDLLLITTGYAIRNNPGALVKLVEDLADVGCAGLLIKKEYIGYVPQNAHTGESGLNVMETVLSGRVPHMRGRLSPMDREIAEHAIEEMALADYALRPLSQLSGGERQRVFIARAIAQRPRIMLMDEPTSNLDMHFQQDVMERIRMMASRQGMTVVTILHDLNLAIAYADQAVLLKDGGIYASGEPRALLDKESIRDIFRVEMDFAALNGVQYAVPHRREN